MATNNRLGRKLPDWADQSTGATGMKFNVGTYAGIVKQNVDPLRMGRLRVWIPDFGGDEDNDDSWRWVTYASPFYGSTYNPNRTTENGFEQSEHTYGMWFVPPDVGNTILCTFVNGDPGRGYWFAVATTTNLSHTMVPGVVTRHVKQSDRKGDEIYDKTSVGGIAEASLNRTDRKSYLPLSEFNEDRESNINPTFVQNKMPVHKYQAEILAHQGLDADNVRGTTSSSSMRETPSGVFGFSTPGRPIKDGDVTPEIRKGGHSFVMDDGDSEGNDQLIRLRTAGGHQILMNDKEQVLYISNSAGSSWLEFTGSGKILMFSASGYAVRTQGALNLHSDTAVNIQGATVNIKATGGMKIGAQTIDIRSSGNMTQYGAKVSIGSGGSLMLTSNGTVGVGANGTLLLKGAAIKLNDGDVAQVEDPGEMKTYLLSDTTKNDVGLWESQAQTLTSIVTVAPTHEPYGRGDPVVPASQVASPNSQRNVCVDKPSSTAPSTTVSPGGAGPFGDYIASHESGSAGYNAFNRGSSPPAGTGSPRESMNLENMTIAEIMSLQALTDPYKRLFAVGRYQLIPATLSAACKSLNIQTSSKFSRDVQDNIFVNYLCKKAAPKIDKYLSGNNIDDEAALLNACSTTAGVWASVEDPLLNPPRGRYDGVGTNRAHGKTPDTKVALRGQWNFLRKSSGSNWTTGSGATLTDGSGNPVQSGSSPQPQAGITAASGKSVTKQAPAELMKRSNAPKTGASIDSVGTKGTSTFIPGLDPAQFAALMTQIAYSESDFAADYNGGTRIGRYAANAIILTEYGYIKPDYLRKYKLEAVTQRGAWTGKDGVESIDDFKLNIAAQDYCMENFIKDSFNYLKSSSPKGLEYEDSVCTVAGMIYVAYSFRDWDAEVGSAVSGMCQLATKWRRENVGTNAQGKTPIDSYNEGRYAIDILSVSGFEKTETAPSTVGVVPEDVLAFGTGNASKENFALLATNFKNALLLAASEYKTKTGKKVTVVSMYRSQEDQERLYKQWIAAGGGPNKPTAAGITTPSKPISMGGTINSHSAGQAIDCGQQAAEIAQTIDLSKYGLRWGGTFKTADAVHIQLASFTPTKSSSPTAE